MAEQTHAERLAEYTEAAERHAQSYHGAPAELWWQGLADTLREAQADRGRLQALEAEAIRMEDAAAKPVEISARRNDYFAINGRFHSATLAEAIDKLKADQEAQHGS